MADLTEMSRVLYSAEPKREKSQAVFKDMNVTERLNEMTPCSGLQHCICEKMGWNYLLRAINLHQKLCIKRSNIYINW